MHASQDAFDSTISAPNPIPKKREETSTQNAQSTQNAHQPMLSVGKISKKFESIKNKAAQAKIKPNIKRPAFSLAFTTIYLFTLLASVVCSTSVINFARAGISFLSLRQQRSQLPRLQQPLAEGPNQKFPSPNQ